MTARKSSIGRGIALAACVAVLSGQAKEAEAQCDPPEEDVKCWTGAVDALWSRDENWDPYGRPTAQEDVFHLIGGEIEFDMGDPDSRIPIQSFTFDPVAQSGLFMNARTGLDVAGSFVSQEPSFTNLYGLSLESGARMDVGGDLSAVEVELIEGITDDTMLFVDGIVGAGNWTVEPACDVRVTAGVDVTDAPVEARSWLIEGDVRVQGHVLGDGHWIVDGTASEDASLLAHRSFEAATLIGRGDVLIRVNALTFEPYYAFIVNLLELDGAVFYQSHGRLFMEVGSVIRLTGGGSVYANSDLTQPFTPLGSVEYGVGGEATNVLSSGWGVSFADPDSVLRGIDGPSSELTIEALGGGVGIASKVHQEAADWDASGVSLEIYVAGFTGLEANSPNLGGIWFADSPCIKPWGRLDVWGPLSEPLELIDDEDNSHPDVLAGTGGREAVYVDGDVTLHDGGSLEHNGLMVYLTGEMMPSCPPPPPPPQLPPICPMNVVQTLYGDFNNDCEIWPVELIELRQVISGIRPYGPIYDFDCDAEVTNEVELQQLVYNINYGVFPCAEQPPDGDGDDGDRSLTVVAFDEVELLETADWLAQNLEVAELEDLAATFQAGAEKYAGTPVGNQFALLADALGD